MEQPLRQLLPSTSQSPFLRQQPSLSGLQPTQFLYFDYFRHEIVPRLGGHVESLENFWLRIILREGMRDACVLDAIVGIGALGLTRYRQSATAPLFLQASSGGDLTPDQHSAINHYINAIGKFRGRFPVLSYDLEPRSFLIITVLLALFELVQGNTKGVSIITTNGLRLLQKQLLHRPTSPSSKSLIAASIDDEGMPHAVSFLARLATLSQAHKREDENCGIFPQSPLLDEATSPPNAEHQVENFTATWFLYLYIISDWSRRVSTALWQGTLDHTDIQLQKEHAGLTNRTKAWIEAMEDRLLSETRHSYRQSLILSLIAAKHTFLFIARGLDMDGTLWDDSKDECMEIINLYKEFTDILMPSMWGANVEYGGYITGLSHMARVCCDYDVRREIKDICRKIGDVQWSWDVKGLMMSTSALIDTDELSRNPDGYIPIASRYACAYTSVSTAGSIIWPFVHTRASFGFHDQEPALPS